MQFGFCDALNENAATFPTIESLLLHVRDPIPHVCG
jgi:hypothetical protein